MSKNGTYVNDGNKHIRIDETPYKLQERVQPFDTFWGRRAVLLASLLVHLHSDSFHLFFYFSRCILCSHPSDTND